MDLQIYHKTWRFKQNFAECTSQKDKLSENFDIY